MSAVALTVAGSDPSGGAGVQADLKTFAAHGVYGTSVLTALTAQNTRGVRGVHVVPAGFVAQQLDAVLDDVTVHATKIGMLADAGVVAAVAAAVRSRDVGRVVLDPVMVATSGDRLLDPAAVAALREDLLPLADLVTPNVPEAAVLLDAEPARDLDGCRAQARELFARSGTTVLLKGGHLTGADSVDVLVGDAGELLLRRPRVDTTATHGTGCTLSSALAAQAALHPGAGWEQLADPARDYLQAALRAGAALRVGSGHGPLDHAFALREDRP
ncbi:bifunctional hydroxymethylpyrimidine kinase/phosphomethylpyrimidine kinase [Kineococcus aurantiacus]|uniref:Hydroxymethylpyrimidine/phosphomethylpyrimidine kinase n=1 Tax=Kineococcus aurantiacus TaxID=37633 RepID=A0A7Y9ATK4_9ACTN|nr:hydroxymethylpyrimidine/phosphomethylpyrimidine kinase [Kineococcus aurantiacus]